MRADLIETFKRINAASNYGRHFSIFLLEVEIYCQEIFQKSSLRTIWTLLLIE